MGERGRLSGRIGRAGGLALAALLFLTVLAVFKPTTALGFTDISPEQSFSEAVAELAAVGVVNGFPDGTFRPYDSVTRAQFVGMLARALSLPTAAEHPFDDVTQEDWFAEPVAAMYQAGLASGVTSDVFAPYAKLSREQATTFVLRGVRYEDAEGAFSSVLTPEQVDTWLGAFPDRGYISSAHRETVAAAFCLGIAGGYADGRFYPFFSLTRSQAALLIHRALYQPLEVKETPPAPTATEAYPELAGGAEGDLVYWVEQRLSDLTYACGAVDAYYDEATSSGVMAFQKAEGLERTGVCTAATLGRLLCAVPPSLRYAEQGDWVEVDLSRQVLMLVREGVLTKTLAISSGASGMSTPTGQYRILYKSWGWVHGPLGWMYSPSYFWPSYAIHGSTSVPPWPASHGCVRTPLWATDELAAELYVGLRVFVYY